MKEPHLEKLLRHVTIVMHLFILSLRIATTIPFKVIRALRRKPSPHAHLKEILYQKNSTGSNFYPLTQQLDMLQSDSLTIAGVLKMQCNYVSKDEIFATLPDKGPKTEIIAIPLAIFAFGFVRHFITILVDFRENIIEFYDPMGVSIYQHHSVVLWGRSCHKGECIFLPEFLDFLKKKYEIDGITDNTDIHQKDWTQCIIFTYDYIYKRGYLGLSIEQAGSNPLSSLDAF